MDAPPPFAVWAASICALLGATVGAGAGTAGGAPQGPPIVRSIDVEYTGPGTVSKERILAQMRTRGGASRIPTKWSSRISRLSTRPAQFKTFASLLSRKAMALKVIVAVQTRSILREIVIDGAERVKAKKAAQRNQIETESTG